MMDNVVQRQVPIWAILLLGVTVGLTTGVSPALGVLLIGAVLAPVLMWCDPRALLLAMAVAIGANIGVISKPINLSTAPIIALIFLGAVLVRFPALRLRRDSAAGLWGASGFLFILCGAPAILLAPNPGAGAADLVQLVASATVIYTATRWVAMGTLGVHTLLPWLVLGLAVSAVPAIAQWMFSIGPAGYMSPMGIRVYSFYGQPNGYAHYLAPLIPLLWAAHRVRGGYRWAIWLAVAMLLLTQSRAGIGAALLGCAFTGLLLYRRRLWVFGLGALAILGLLGALIVHAPEEMVLQRLDLANDWSAQQRALILLTTFDALMQRPFLGYGPGSFAAVLEAFARTGLIDMVEMPHNIFIDIWFQYGLLGLVGFVVLVVGYYIGGIRAYRRTGDPILAGLLGSFTVTMAASMMGSFFVRGIEQYLVLIIALTGGLALRSAQERSRGAESTESA